MPQLSCPLSFCGHRLDATRPLDDAFIVYVTRDPTYVTILTAEDAAKFNLKYDGKLPTADDIANMKEFFTSPGILSVSAAPLVFIA